MCTARCKAFFSIGSTITKDLTLMSDDCRCPPTESNPIPFGSSQFYNHPPRHIQNQGGTAELTRVGCLACQRPVQFSTTSRSTYERLLGRSCTVWMSCLAPGRRPSRSSHLPSTLFSSALSSRLAQQPGETCSTHEREFPFFRHTKRNEASERGM